VVLVIGPNPQTPNPNPQSPIPNPHVYNEIEFDKVLKLIFKKILKI